MTLTAQVFDAIGSFIHVAVRLTCLHHPFCSIKETDSEELVGTKDDRLHREAIKRHQ